MPTAKPSKAAPASARSPRDSAKPRGGRTAREAAKAKPEQPADKKSSKRDLSLARIIDAAVRLFATQGYWNSTLEEVATAAGFTKGAVYYHFRSKEHLLLKVLEPSSPAPSTPPSKGSGSGADRPASNSRRW